MFVIRLIFIIAAIWLARKAWQMAKKALEDQSTQNPGNQQQNKADKPSEMMVTCKHCSTHIPESSAISKDGNWFCNTEHLEAWHREQSG